MRLRARFRILSVLCAMSLVLTGAQVAPLAAAPSVEAQSEVSAQFFGSQRFWGTDTDAGDNFGHSIDMDGDYAVVGAYTAGEGGSAYVFEFVDGYWTQRQELTASNAAAGDWFGMSVAIDGDTIAVGAPGDESLTGSAYVFTRSGTTWTEQTQLIGAGTTAGNLYGMSVDLDAGTLVVGSQAHGGPGAAFVYTGSGSSWALQQEFTGSDSGSNRFGETVRISGDTLVAGAINYTGGGAAYVFTRTADVWTQQQRLLADDRAASDQFGDSLAIESDTIVVGAPRTDHGFAADAEYGSAYVFTRSGTTWSQNQTLIASDASGGDWYGSSVALSGGTILVGATYAGVTGRGRAYALRNEGGTWSERALLDKDADLTSFFGQELVLQGDMALVTAPADSLHGANSGLAYAFDPVVNTVPVALDDPTAMNWSSQVLAEDPSDWAAYGRSVAIEGDVAVIGAPWADSAGAAYVLEKVSGQWQQSAKLVSSDPVSDEFFGQSVDIQGGTIVVGEYQDAGGGAVHVFTGSGTTWTHRAKIVASDRSVNDAFGISVAISGNSIVVGASGDNGIGAAYTFIGGGATWNEEEKFVGGALSDNYGVCVDIDQDTVVVGAPLEDSLFSDSGAVHVWTRENSDWSFEAKLLADDPANSDLFGESVAVVGDTVLSGAKYDDDNDNVSGSVYAFSRTGTTWTQDAKILPTDGSAQDQFGSAVAFDGATAIIGAHGTDPAGLGDYTGSAYVFSKSGSAWTELTRLESSAPDDGARFGCAVAIDGDSAVVGAYQASPLTLGEGEAYLFDSYYMVDEDQTLTVEAPGTLANDFDPDGGTVEVNGSFQASNGYVAQTNTGSFTYDPQADFNGFDSFQYLAYDGQGHSDPATVNIYIRPVHDYIPVQGDTRFETGAEAARIGFPSGADTVLVATGRNFPDALGGSALAGAVDAPLLLVDTASVPSDVAAVIGELGATEAIVLGGTGAVKSAVETQLLAAMGPGSTTRRIAGADRYETGRKIAAETIDVLGVDYSGTAFVATGKNFPDALAAGPIAASAGWPIYLVSNTAADATTLQAMDAKGVTGAKVVGGTSVVTPATYNSLTLRFGGAAVQRHDGINRYDTAAQVSQMGVDEAGMSWNGVGLATGTAFPDALAAGAMLGARSRVLLLSAPTSLSIESETALSDNRFSIDDVHFFGGTGALSTAVRTRVQQVIEAP